MSNYKVVETPHTDPASAKVVAEFSTRQEALISSVKSMKTHLTELCKPGLNANELFDLWKGSGIGYHIEPEVSNAPFSDIDFARLFVLRLTNDYSHPLFLEVSTVDCLLTASGVTSPTKQWKFWVKAPSTYKGDGLEALMNAGTEFLYDEMSSQSSAADGSRLILLEKGYRTVSEEEALTAMASDRSAMLYFVQNDGSFRRSMPTNPMSVAR